MLDHYNALIANRSFFSDATATRLTGDVLLTYLVHPGTAVHVGFTDNYEEAASDPHRPFRIPTVPAGRQIFAKISYLLRF